MSPTTDDAYRAFAELLTPPPGYDPASALEALGLELSGPLDAEVKRTFDHGSSRDWPPYETEYGVDNLFQQTQELADIAGFYRAWGLSPERERPDHASVELEFLAYLAEKETAARTDEHRSIAREARRKFLADHAGRWMPVFAARLERTPSTFYQAYARALKEFIRRETEALGAVPATLRSMDLRPAEPPGEMECGACVFGEPQ